MANKPLIRPYFWGRGRLGVGGVRLTSHVGNKGFNTALFPLCFFFGFFVPKEARSMVTPKSCSSIKCLAKVSCLRKSQGIVPFLEEKSRLRGGPTKGCELQYIHTYIYSFGSKYMYISKVNIYIYIYL